MKHNGKEIKNGYTLDSINELPALVTDFVSTLGDNVHLVDCNVKVGFDTETEKQVVRVMVTTFVGDMPKPKRC